jgi:hypothetical protein
VRTRIAHYDAELKMSNAEAEIAKLANNFNVEVTTDFGQIEQMLQDKISLNRAKSRVASDLSGISPVDIQREQVMESVLAEQALKQFESQQKLAAPGTDDSEIVQEADATETRKKIERRP